MFYDIEEMSLKKVEKHDNLADLVLTQDIEDEEKNVIVARAFEPLSRAVLKQIATTGTTALGSSE